MPDIACINGQFRALADARVPIEDRGYQFADGVYEVIVAPNGQPFLLEEHFARLARSLAGIALECDPAGLRLAELIAEGIARCEYRDVMVYLQITRGCASRNHAIPSAATPTVVMTFKKKPVYDPRLRRCGVGLMTQTDTRWAKCSIKSIALLPNVLLKHQAREHGFYDALIVAADGTVRETSCANIFMVTGGELWTPPKSDHILHGVSRGHVLACARKLDIPIRESDFDLPTLRGADEVFITSSTMDVMPVTRIDESAIGEGKVGEITRRLASCFNAGAPASAE